MPPRNVVLLVADSLRFDAVHRPGAPSGLPWTMRHGATFTGARSAGCWTLPATASLFTGRMPHEHGADAQTRAMHADVPTLAERLSAAGFDTAQVTANIATTDIFGLDRGFARVLRTWQRVPMLYPRLHGFLAILGKPRLRKRILSTDYIAGKLAEDLDCIKVWLQRTMDATLDGAREVLEANDAAGRRSFVFVNLMETHFPYHLGDTFETSATGLWARLRELRGLFHYVNQTWLTTGRQPVDPAMLAVLRERQRRAWQRLAPLVDAFVEERASRGDLVVFCGDHGDAFGEDDWIYHFNNVTDGGNRVPLHWIDPARAGTTLDAPVSTRHVHEAILRAVGLGDEGPDPLFAPHEDVPVLQSAWYDNQGRTLPRYRFNQLAFTTGDRRWMRRRGRWHTAPVAAPGDADAPWEPLDRGVDPVEEVPLGADLRARLRGTMASFGEYSRRIGGDPW
jgi:arylsulfatase